MTTYRGEDMIGDNGYGTEESIHKHTPGPETNVRENLMGGNADVATRRMVDHHR